MQTSTCFVGAGLVAALFGLGGTFALADQDDRPFVPDVVVSSTIPADGDLNPYGIAFVPAGFPEDGSLRVGDVLVANFNATNNLQGTGTTIIKFTPARGGPVVPFTPAGMNGNASTFFKSKLAGLTTALGVLKRGFIIVGNVPTTDGTVNTISNGALQIIDRHGKLVTKLVDDKFLDSPWDLTIDDDGDHALLFVSNVLSGTVTRLNLQVTSKGVDVVHKTVIAKGYKHEPNSAALVLGPTGLVFDESRDILYVASTDDNAIFAVLHAAQASAPVNKGTLVFSNDHLRGPLGLAQAPNGHLLAANGDAVNADPTQPSEIVEFTREGEFVRQFDVDSASAAAFGLATVVGEHARFNLAVVDDNTNAIAVYGLPVDED
jgi:sugar lactone lactonase YvrE